MSTKEVDKNFVDIPDEPTRPESVRLSDGTVFYKATTPSDTQPVSATNLDIRDLTAASDSVKIGDGSNTATIRNLAANDALNVALVDAAGDQIVSFGGGVQYTEGDTDATITGTAMMMEDAANTLVAAPGTAADGLLVNLGTNNDVRITDGTNIASVRDTGSSDSLNVAIVDASGNQITTFGGGSQYVEDVASAGGETMTLAGAIREDTPTTTTTTDGDYSNLKTDSAGRLWVNASGAAVPITDNAGSLTVDGTVAATQSGTWNITDISGTVSLPTGASTSAKQDTGNTSLSSIDGKITACNTGAVVISNASGASAVNIQDGGNSITVDATNLDVALSTRLKPADTLTAVTTVGTITNVVHVDDNSGSLTVDGSVTANPTFPSSSSVTQVASSASSVTLKASNASRRGLSIFNDSTQTLYLKLGATASTTSYTVQVPSQGFYELPQVVYTGVIDGIWASANGNAYVTEIS